MWVFFFESGCSLTSVALGLIMQQFDVFFLFAHQTNHAFLRYAGKFCYLLNIYFIENLLFNLFTFF